MVSYPDARLSDLVLDEDQHPDDSNAYCWSIGNAMRWHDMRFVPRNDSSALVYRAPGKTSTARVVAGEAGLPLFLAIRLDSIITKFMGETAAKLRLDLQRPRRDARCVSVQ